MQGWGCLSLTSSFPSSLRSVSHWCLVAQRRFGVLHPLALAEANVSVLTGHWFDPPAVVGQFPITRAGMFDYLRFARHSTAIGGKYEKKFQLTKPRVLACIGISHFSD
jgi:hypothetical protein